MPSSRSTNHRSSLNCALSLALPVWIANYRYQEKLFQILINGRTGKVSGERPYSFWKIAGLVVFIIAVVAGIVIAAQHGQHPHHLR